MRMVSVVTGERSNEPITLNVEEWERVGRLYDQAIAALNDRPGWRDSLKEAVRDTPDIISQWERET